MVINKHRIYVHIQENLTIYLFVTTLFVTGIIFGAIVVNSMTFMQKQDLFFHLNQFYERIHNEEAIVGRDILEKSFYFHIKYLLILFILGLTIIGMPLIWLLIFLKGLVIGFSVGFIVNQLGWKGLILATLSIAPQNMIIIPVYIVAGSFAMLFSVMLLHKLFSRRINETIMRPFGTYISVYGILFILAFSASLVETFLTYEIVKIFINNYY